MDLSVFSKSILLPVIFLKRLKNFYFEIILDLQNVIKIVVLVFSPLFPPVLTYNHSTLTKTRIFNMKGTILYKLLCTLLYFLKITPYKFIDILLIFGLLYNCIIFHCVGIPEFFHHYFLYMRT